MKRTRLACVLATTTFAIAAGCGIGGSTEEFCKAFAGINSPTTRFEGFDPTDAETALERLRPARIDLGKLLEAAPEEVRGDVKAEIDFVQALIDALEAVDPGDPRRAAAEVQRVTDAHPGVETAAAALATFAERECGS